MGNCCSGQTVDHNGDIKTLEAAKFTPKLNQRQLYLLTKIQAICKGYITRKKMRTLNYHGGMGGLMQWADGEMQ
jgi:hypothetical protein